MWRGRMSIRIKLLISSVGMLVCACTCISAILIQNTAALLHENNRSQSEQELTSIANGYANAIARQAETIEEFREYQPLIRYLEKDFTTTYERYIDFTNTVGAWVQWLTSSSQPLCLKIYMDDTYESISYITGGRLEQIQGQPWYDPTSFDTQVTLGKTWVNGKYTDALIYYRNVWDSARREIRRVITASQAEADLRAGIITREGTIYYLTDHEGGIISSNDVDALGLSLQSAFLPAEQAEDGTVIELDGASYLLRTAPLTVQNANLPDTWRIFSLYPYDEIAVNVYSQILWSVGVCTLIVAVALFFASTLTYDITARLRQLMAKMDLLAKGDFASRIVVQGSDEIARVSVSFDEMSEQIWRLIQDKQAMYQSLLQAEQREKQLLVSQKDAEYQVLRAQINPHYLFNTLEVIRMKLLLEGEREAARIMRLFAETIREYMDVQRVETSLGEELRFVRHYMEIQRFRMGDRLTWEERVPPELLGISIPRLLLQPIVENAVQHGIDRRVEGGKVCLSASLKDMWLEIRVEDNGVGMNQHELDALEKRLNDAAADEHLGLWNIHRRLTLLYGEGLHIESAAGAGTAVTLRVHSPKGKKAGVPHV